MKKKENNHKHTKRSVQKAAGVAVAVLLTGALAACGGRTEQEEEHRMTENQEVVRISAKQQDNGDGTVTSTVAEYPTANELDRTLMQGVNHLAYDMAERLSENGGNYFFSPYSISSALTLLGNAAEGETKAQMEAVLGITDIENWNMQLAYYMDAEQPAEAMLTSANSLWFDMQFTPSEQAYTQYLPLVEFYYDAQLYQADFRNAPEDTKNRINEWIEAETGGMISDYLSDVERDTVMALFNAVYFYGEWSFPFMAQMTTEEVFHGAQGDVIVDMMHQSELWLPYYEQGDLRGISLPYGDGSKVMNVLLPVEGSELTAAELFEALSEEEKNAFLQSVMKAESSWVEMLQLPKFSMNYKVGDFKAVLESLGMTDAFCAGVAQFPGIGDVYVSDAGHMAVLEVDEMGSRAAALTEMMMKNCALVQEDNAVRFMVDRPFVFFIQDKETGMILFMGQVNVLE